MRPSAGFLARFLLSAAVLFALWALAGVSDVYSRMIVRLADPLIGVLTGFQVTKILPQPAGLDIYIGQDGEEGRVPLQPRELFSGIVPFLALLTASSPLPPRRRLAALGIGVLIFVAFHIGLLLIGVYLSGGPQMYWSAQWRGTLNKLIDVVYGFYGLVGFVALPFLLWFWLARPTPVAAQPGIDPHHTG